MSVLLLALSNPCSNSSPHHMDGRCPLRGFGGSTHSRFATGLRTRKGPLQGKAGKGERMPPARQHHTGALWQPICYRALTGT
ncbi:uncharacterized protein CCOS01_12651 [Colletotrichum costaricense]|uniref:Uncharacterized protein n=2 Tax=Colletotrichum acutatum species complex TaxID=2707335 RepID=A0AAJ0DWK8_9PEZI|nr:uncharacterized protein CCOS01_12651 [Colletotrichum costaricense]KAK1517102.1 hypothetical protein CCOS01_12651 [Colletotrichum costaricense]